ncbi:MULTISPECIES: hypothetical protein [Deinococcus]|uniref:Uncharacterized protein n=1 Tax=Deinococcus ruber TaxID=1848197 RepID=A0A918BWT3_9DEIO|nr:MULTISPECIES: hypothetical protein [Deinococcus]ULH15870.1 hypothetical protein MF271_04330 [Deinococcus sp. KNUC1210]GGQ92911.1 hypothetical protein GCM10008957_01090 [Deinococcus ruber]
MDDKQTQTTLFPKAAPAVFRLCIYTQPWQATLEPLTPFPAGRPESFLSPLELLERLEQSSNFPFGLR